MAFRNRPTSPKYAFSKKRSRRARDRISSRSDRKGTTTRCSSSSTPSPPTTISSRSVSPPALKYLHDLQFVRETCHRHLRALRGGDSNYMNPVSRRTMYILSAMDSLIASLSPPPSTVLRPSSPLKERFLRLPPFLPPPDRRHHESTPTTRLVDTWTSEHFNGQDLTGERDERRLPSLRSYMEFGHPRLQNPCSLGCRNAIPFKKAEPEENWNDLCSFPRRVYAAQNNELPYAFLPQNSKSVELDEISMVDSTSYQSYSDRGDECPPFQKDFPKVNTMEQQCPLQQKLTRPWVKGIPDFTIPSVPPSTPKNIFEGHLAQARREAQKDESSRLKLQFPYKSVQQTETCLQAPKPPIERKKIQDDECQWDRYPGLTFEQSIPCHNRPRSPPRTRLERLEGRQISGSNSQKLSASRNFPQCREAESQEKLDRMEAHQYKLNKLMHANPLDKKMSKMSIFSSQQDTVKSTTQPPTRTKELKKTELPDHIRFGVFNMRHRCPKPILPLPKPRPKITAQSARFKIQNALGRQSLPRH